MATDVQTSPRALVEHALELIRDFKLEELGQTCFAEDATWEVMGADYMGSGPRYVGRDAIIGDFLTGIVPAVFDFDGPFGLEITGIHGDGPVVVVEWFWQATPRGGGHYSNPYCLVMEIADGRIKAVREYLPTHRAKEILF